MFMVCEGNENGDYVEHKYILKCSVDVFVLIKKLVSQI